MKKILVTLVAMCASFFAMADFISGTSFENYDNGGVFDPAKDDAGSTTATYWSTNAYDSVLSNYAQGVQLPARPEHFAAGITNTYLYVDTSSATLDRYINPLVSGEGGDTHAVTNINAGLYFDSLVQFTASDTPVEQFSVATGDKLAVWLLATEDDPETTELNEASTNLVVTAGFLGVNNSVVCTNYVISTGVTNIAPGSWHRLTIKAIGELGTETGVAGFVVFVDGVAVTSTVAKADATGTVFASLNATAQKWANDNALFPSIVPHDDLSAQTLSSVSFKGTGAIDDLVFTTQAPSFAAEATTFTLTWDEGVTAVQYKIGEGAWTTATKDLAVPNTTGSVLVNVTYDSANGYIAGQWKQGGTNITANVGGDTQIDFTAPTRVSIASQKLLFQVGGNNYATLDDAKVAAGEGATVKLLGDVSACLVFDEGNDLVIDLAGNDIVAPDELDDSAIYVDGTSKLLVIDSVGGGVISSTSVGSGAIWSEGTTTIGAATGDAGATINGMVHGAVLVKGNLSYVGNTTEGGEPLFGVDENSEAVHEGDYWVVSLKGSEPPATTYFALTLPTVAGASAVATTNGVEVANLAAIESNATVLVTWTAAQDYKITAGGTESFTMEADRTAATPTVVEVVYGMVTITQVSNCTIAVTQKVGGQTVATGAKFDVDTAVVLTVVRTAAEGWELDGCVASEEVTVTGDVTITATVKAAAPADWPADPASVSGQTAFAAFGIAGDLANADAATLATWAKANTVPYGSAILTDAFLLNCANTTEAIATAAADFKITSITVDGGTVTIEPANFGNGKVVIKGAATLGNTFVDPVTTSHRFFKGALAVPTMPE